MHRTAVDAPETADAGFQVKGFVLNVNSIRRAVPYTGFAFYTGIRYLFCPEFQRETIGLFICLPESNVLIKLF